MTVYGDVYCGDDLHVDGNIKGDIFADSYDDHSAEIDGQFYDIDDYDSNVLWPGINSWRFEPSYYIDTERYWPVIVGPTNNNVKWGASSDNPAGIYLCYGDYQLTGDVTINGTLVVTGNLEIKTGPLKITAIKNYPALIVEGKITIADAGSLETTGLVQTRRLRLDRENDEAVGQIIIDAISQQFVIPEFPRRAEIFFISVEIADLVFMLSQMRHGEITPIMCEEAQTAMVSYLRAYLPEKLPRKSAGDAKMGHL